MRRETDHHSLVPTSKPNRSKIEHAIASGAIRGEFQPIRELASRRLVGIEVLARLDIDGLAVSPATFIPVAEELGLLDVLLQHVVAACDAIRHERPSGVYTAINVAGFQLLRTDAASRLLRAAHDAGIASHQLVVELTESDIVEIDSRSVSDQLDELRSRGVRIAVDDLGTGYSNVAAVVALRPDIVKIDQTLVRGLPGHPWHDVVEAFVHVAHSVDAHVVAEGIERPAQLEALLELGVDAGQGYLLGRPARSLASSDPVIDIAPTEPTRRAPRVGIVDDDPRLSALVAELLADEGYEVAIHANDPATFLSHLRRTPIDIAIIDMVLADREDGIRSVARPLRHLRPEIQLVVFSSLFDPDIRAEAVDLGCVWVEKASGPEDLLHVIDEIVGARSGWLAPARPARSVG